MPLAISGLRLSFRRYSRRKLFFAFCVIVLVIRIYDRVLDLIFDPRIVNPKDAYIPVQFSADVSVDQIPTKEQAVDYSTNSSRHLYREDGLLETNPDGPHPILELIEQAQKRWDAKHKKASTTLKQACDEYEKRYGRKPPRGFNDW